MIILIFLLKNNKNKVNINIVVIDYFNLIKKMESKNEDNDENSEKEQNSSSEDNKINTQNDNSIETIIASNYKNNSHFSYKKK